MEPKRKIPVFLAQMITLLAWVVACSLPLSNALAQPSCGGNNPPGGTTAAFEDVEVGSSFTATSSCLGLLAELEIKDGMGGGNMPAELRLYEGLIGQGAVLIYTQPFTLTPGDNMIGLDGSGGDPIPCLDQTKIYTFTIAGVNPGQLVEIQGYNTNNYMDGQAYTSTGGYDPNQDVFFSFTGSDDAEIDVQGNGISIPDGDATPDVADHTDFGSVPAGATLTLSFDILNVGNEDLELTGTPIVALSGDPEFTVTVQPANTTLPEGASESFSIEFAPGMSNTTYNATVSILNTDCNEEDYTFSITGMGAVCVDPDIPTVNGSPNPVCPGEEVTLIASGNLNDAQDWFWYTGSCGGTLVGTGASIMVNPMATTTYFVRGEGGCVTGGDCATIIITVEDDVDPQITCPSDIIVSADANCEAVVPDFTVQMGQLIANSVDDFSNTQGGGGWFYGFYPPNLPQNFTELDPNDFAMNTWLGTQTDNTPFLGAGNGAPGVDDGVWVVRRWVSTHTGSVNISGSIMDMDANCGDGAHVRILRNGSQVFSFLNVPPAMPFPYSLPLTVEVGDVIDFVVDPILDTECDNTLFTAVLTALTDLVVSDNCGVVNITQSPAPGTIVTEGITEVELTAFDALGNSASCTVDFVVVDNTPPSAVCAPITVQLDGFGNAMIMAEDVDGGSSDACGPVTLQIDITSFGCEEVGDNEVTLTVTDESGNSSDCVALVTVGDDNVQPVALCMNATVSLDANGMIAITPLTIDAGSNGVCGIESISVVPSNFTCLQVGDNTVTLNVEDFNGNMASCMATVTVEDNTPPTVTCNNPTIQLDATGNVTLSIGQVNAGANDACGVGGFNLDVNAFTCADIGENPVTLTVTDVNGNQASCVSTVTVEDNVAPEALCQAVTVQLDDTGNGSIIAAEVDNGSNDACGLASLSLDITDFTCADVGEVTVTLTVTDVNGNSSTCEATVTVEDNVAPSASCVPFTVELDANGNGSITGADIDGGSDDNCGIASLVANPNTFTCDDLGEVPVILTVTDVNGNSSTCEATVTVEDNTAPEIECVNFVAQLDDTGNITVDGADLVGNSTDACGDLTITVDPNTFDCTNIGDNPVTVTVEDGSGNSTSCNAVVTVEDNVAPDAQCQPVTIQLDASGMASVAPDDVDNGSSDACGIATLALDITTFDCAQAGPNTVTLTVTDVNGNSSTCEATVTVTDALPPTALCLNITIQLDNMGDASITPNQLDGGSTDNCGIVSRSLDVTDFTCDQIGDNTVTLTVTDAAGNSDECTGTVTVEDNLAPTALCQNITVFLGADGTVLIADEDLNNGSGDNCEIEEIKATQVLFTCSDIGDNPVTLNVTDVNNNTASCIATVTVVDDQIPTAVCMDAVIQIAPAGIFNLTPALIDGGSEDNCSLALSVDPVTFTCDDIGFQQATLTVMDGSGNSDECTATITVLASDACEEPEITNMGGNLYADPCFCLGDGLFGEELIIGPALSGMQWTVASNTGLLDPDNSLAPFPVGTSFVEVPDPMLMGMSRYVLVGVHVDSVGYALEAESPFYPGLLLAISNVCYYPDPSFVGLNDAYCINSNPFQVIGDPGTNNIVNAFITIDGENTDIFDPSALGLGTHIVTFTVDAGDAGPGDISDPGCIVTITQEVEVVNSFPGVVACNPLITVAVDQACEALITPDMVLEGDYYCYDEFEVVLFLNGNQIPNPVPIGFFGTLLNYTVTNLSTGNNCSGQIMLEDNLPPVVDCNGEAIEVVCTDDLGAIPPPSVDENCVFDEILLIDEVFLNEDPCDDGTVILQRTWIATDIFGNVSDPCIQLIEIYRVDNDLIDFPNDIVWSCAQYEDFPNITDPNALHPVIKQYEIGTLENDATGFILPNILANTGSGNPGDINDLYCGFEYTFQDDTIPGCGNSFTIKRTWTVLDECTNELITSNAAGEDNVQIISVSDVTPPEISVNPFTLSANLPGPNNTCKSIGFLPAPTVTDDCNEWTVRIFTPIGEAIYLNGTDGSQGGTVPFPGLGLGVHTIVYEATDVCGKTGTFEIQVEVIDDIAPTPVCDEITDVNITTGGLAIVNATTFDDGSVDNCCIADFEVKRVGLDCTGNPDDFGPTVTFCCDDIANNPIFVILRVYDCNGNFNDCEVEVMVNDKSDPILIFCPEDAQISCEDYYENYAAALDQEDFDVLNGFGQPIFQDNCGPDGLTINLNVQVQVDMCGVGVITRTWTATDPSGNGPLQCTQKIYVYHVSDWVVEFPADIDAECIDGTLPPFGEPEIFFDDCELIATSYEDLQLDIVPDACYKILRTWTVINWCIFDDYGYDAWSETGYAECNLNVDWDGDGDKDCRTFREGYNTGQTPDGYISYTQTIKVIDEEAPEFVIPPIDGCILDSDCNTDLVLPYPTAMDDCSDQVTVDILGHFGSFYNITSSVVVEDVEIGTYTIVYRVKDNCGNTTYEEVEIEVMDCKNPTPQCITLVTEIMQTQMLDVSADIFDAGSYDNCSDELIFSFSGDITDNILTITCDDANDTLDLQIFVTDASGNQGICVVTLEVQDNLNVCGNNNQIITIAGLIATEEDDAVEDVMVDVNGGMFYMPTTTDGWYELDVDAGGDYSIIPALDENHGNGISTYDMVLITRHILGVDLLDSPYKIIAADANRSGGVSTLDLVEIRKIVLQIADTFSNNTSWRFVDADYMFPNPQNPWAGGGFPEFMNINNLDEDELDADFVAVKVGDVNGSAQTNSLAGAEDRTFAGAIHLQAADRVVEAGETFTLYVTAGDWSVSGYQFTLQFDPALLAFQGLEEGLLKQEHFGRTFLEEGALTCSWHQEQPRAFAADETLFGLAFTALQDARLSDLVHLGSRRTAAEAYGPADELLDVQLSFQEALSDGFALYQNAPNPFEEATQISFQLPEACQARLTVLDASGRVLQVLEGAYAAGYHEIRLDGLAARGVLYYRLDTPTHSATKKMIRLD